MTGLTLVLARKPGGTVKTSASLHLHRLLVGEVAEGYRRKCTGRELNLELARTNSRSDGEIIKERRNLFFSDSQNLELPLCENIKRFL